MANLSVTTACRNKKKEEHTAKVDNKIIFIQTESRETMNTTRSFTSSEVNDSIPRVQPGSFGTLSE